MPAMPRGGPFRAIGAQEHGDAVADRLLDPGGCVGAVGDGVVQGEEEGQGDEVIRGEPGIRGVEQSESCQVRETLRKGVFGGVGEPVAVQFGKVAGFGREESTQQRVVGGEERVRGDLPGESPQCLREIGDLGEVLVDRASNSGDQRQTGLVDDREEEGLLVAEVVVHGPLGHPGLGSDGVDARSLVSLAEEQVARSTEDARALAR